MQIRVLIVVLLMGAAACSHCTSKQNNSSNGDPPANVPIPSGTSVSFVVFGDWGSGDNEQEEVAHAIGDYCQTQTCEFIITLGDNFYGDGVESTADEQWQTKYRDIYGNLNLPFYVSLGNHDMYGNEQAQIDYSNIDSSWNMPGEYYSFVRPENSESPVVEFFIFNSEDFDKEQQQWMTNALTTTQATWKILVMHHPIYSNGSHGDDDKGNNEDLLPIICNQIDLVLSGHDHNFSHLSSSEDGCPIEQLVVGTGGAGLRSVDTDDSRVQGTASVHGFGWLQIAQDQIFFRMIKKDGTIIYNTSWEKD